jgi:hypothetical protein
MDSVDASHRALPTKSWCWREKASGRGVLYENAIRNIDIVARPIETETRHHCQVNAPATAGAIFEPHIGKFLPKSFDQTINYFPKKSNK